MVSMYPFVSSRPVGVHWSRSSRFTDFTATSARPFDLGKWAEDSLCLTFHVFKGRRYNLGEINGQDA